MSGSAFANLGSLEERFQLILEGAPDAIVVTSQDGRIVLVNTQTELLFGYAREELLGQKVEVLLPQRARRRHTKDRAAYLRHPGVRPMGTGLELYGRRKDGSEFPVDVSLSHMETGGETLVSGFIRDITERKRSEEGASHLASMIQASDDAIIGKSMDGTVVSWNPGAERLFGYKAEEVIGRPMAMLVPPELTGEFARIMKGLRHGKHIEHYETTRLHKDGHRVEISVTISPFRDRKGVVVGASAIARDITRQKLIEELVSHFAAIVETSEDAIISASLDGSILSWNAGAERLYGYKAQEMVGRPLALEGPPGQADKMARVMKALRHGEHFEHYEISQLHKDGHPIEASVTISPVKGKGGAVVGASVIARDITRQKRAEEALRQSEERFRVALESAPVVVFNQDLELRYTWINSPILAWAEQDWRGRTDAEIVGGQEGARLTAIKQEVLRSGQGTRAEIAVTFQGETHYFDLVVEPLRDAHGTLLGLTCSSSDITPAKKILLERENLIAKLQEALEEVKLLSGLLSICASCKRIRNEREKWEPLESYVQSHSEAKFTHGVCPDCLRKLYPDYYPESGQEPPKTA